MVLQGVLSVLPLLLLIMLGFFAARLAWFGPGGMHFLSKLSLNITIPVYLFYNMIRIYSHPREFMHLFGNLPYPVMIILGGMFVGGLMARMLRIRPPQRGVFINAVSLSNTVIMGIPVVISLFGDAVVPVAMVFYASNTLMYWTVGVWLIGREVGGSKGGGFWEPVKAVFTTRPLLGFLLGILWVCTRIPMPGFMMRTMSMIGSSVTPLAMIFIGCVIRFADFRSIAHLRELVIVTLYRLAAVPVITGLFCYALPVEPMMKKVFFLLANMPSMAQLPIMAKELESDYELASMTTAATTAVGMAAVPLYVGLMEHFRFPA